ncbi:MAG: hypothetical protein L0Z50_18485 [Verrucomicrobiales bacterium]|nr:hypothetical protein [Verrucomicrobiales bacterium]
MNRQEAKFILRAYRHGGQDADDPQFAEALELVKHDPDLAAWFANESLIDSRLQQKVVAAIPIPPDLKRRLLAAKHVVRPVVWWRRREWVTAAALALLLFCLAAVFWFAQRPTARLADLRQFAVQASLQEAEHVTLRQSDLAQIRQWLSENQGAPDFVLPAGLLGRSPMGCRVLQWQGRNVSLICFQIDGDKHVDLFVIKQTAWADAKRDSKPHLARVNDYATASWSIGNKTCVLAGAAANADLHSILRKGA